MGSRDSPSRLACSAVTTIWTIVAPFHACSLAIGHGTIVNHGFQTDNQVKRSANSIHEDADEQSDARERRSRADLQCTMNRRRPVIGGVMLPGRDDT